MYEMDGDGSVYVCRVSVCLPEVDVSNVSVRRPNVHLTVEVGTDPPLLCARFFCAVCLL